MRSLRTTQILASRSLLLSARSTAPRPPPPRWPLGKELPLVPSSRALQRWIAGAVSFSLTFTMAAAAEVRAKERLPTDLLPQNVMLYQYQAFPFCNKVRDLRRISWSMSISNILFDLIRYKPEVGNIIVGRVIEIAPKRWRLDMNFSQDAVLMLSSMNLPDGIQRRRTAVDELNMRSIFEENDVVCAEVRGFQHDGSLQLQARSQKYGKLKRGQLLTVPAYLVKRRKQHFHHLEQYDVDLILGCNGFIWVGEHVVVREITNPNEEQEKPSAEVETFTSMETRKHICRLANAVRVLSALGFTLTIELVIETAEASLSSNVKINDMLGAEFYVQTAEREAKRRAGLLGKKGGARKNPAAPACLPA